MMETFVSLAGIILFFSKEAHQDQDLPFNQSQTTFKINEEQSDSFEATFNKE